MPVDKFQKFVKQFPTKRFDKGEIILVQGEVPTCAYLVQKGVVKIYNLTSAGEEKPIMFELRGEAFPTPWIFGKIKYALYYYEAFTECELFCIPPDEYQRFLRENPDEMFKLFSYFIGRNMHYQMRINALEQSKAAAKVLNTIHFLCLRFGRELKDNVVQIQLPLTQQDLANFMGLTRETTGIELKKLQRKGVLTYRKQMYIVKISLLDELLDEEYDQGRIRDHETVLANINDTLF